MKTLLLLDSAGCNLFTNMEYMLTLIFLIVRVHVCVRACAGEGALAEPSEAAGGADQREVQ